MNNTDKYKEYIENRKYNNEIYELVIKERIRKDGKIPEIQKTKIRRYGRLPGEIQVLFQGMEEMGIIINQVPIEKLQILIQQAFELIEKNSEYDKDLMQKIGALELARWRLNTALREDNSFSKIVETLRDHAVPYRAPTKVQQNSRTRFVSKGEYFKKESL